MKNGHTNEAGPYLCSNITKMDENKLAFLVDESCLTTLKEKLNFIKMATGDEGRTPFFKPAGIADAAGVPGKKLITLESQVPLADALGMLMQLDIVSQDEAQKVDLNVTPTDFTASRGNVKDNSFITQS